MVFNLGSNYLNASNVLYIVKWVFGYFKIALLYNKNLRTSVLTLSQSVLPVSFNSDFLKKVLGKNAFLYIETRNEIEFLFMKM